MGIFGGIFIVVFIFILVLLISFLIIKLKRTKQQPKIPESTSTSNRDIDEIHEVDEEDEDENNHNKKTGFFKRKAKTYSSTSSKKKLVLNNDNSNNVKLKLLNNELNMNSVHNTFQREIKLKNYVDQSTTTTKTLEKNLIKEASKRILNRHQESEKSTSVESLNKSDNKDSSPVKISPNIISPDYNYIQLYNSNKKIKIKNINKEDAEVAAECENLIKKPDQMIVVINEQNNLDKEDSVIIEDCQGIIK